MEYNIGSSNRIIKYADDCSLMVPEKCDVDMSDEFQHVLNWAVVNKLTIKARNYLAPSELPGIKRVLCAKLLGVWLQNDFSMRKHVDYIMHTCNQRSYLLTQFKRQGLPMAQLQSVFDAIVLLVYFMQHPLGEAILVKEKWPVYSNC